MEKLTNFCSNVFTLYNPPSKVWCTYSSKGSSKNMIYIRIAQTSLRQSSNVVVVFVSLLIIPLKLQLLLFKWIIILRSPKTTTLEAWRRF